MFSRIRVLAASYKVTKISRSIGVDYRDKSERGIKWGKKEGGEEENKRGEKKRKQERIRDTTPVLRNRGARVSISGWWKVSPGRGGKFSQIPEALEPRFSSCSNSDRKSIGPSPLWNAGKSTCICPPPLRAPRLAFHGDIELFIASNERNERLKRSQETKRRLAIVVLRTDTRGNGRSRRRFRRLPREFAYEGATLVSKITNVGLVNATALNTELAGIMKKIGKKDFSM